MNKIILLGRLTKNPEIKYSQTNNIKVGYFTIAVNRKYVKQGEDRQTDFINIVTYSKLAEFTEKYLKQGLQICICGRLQIRNWEDKNGQKHYISEVIAEDIDFADSLKKQQADENVLYSSTPSNGNSTQVNNLEDTEELILDSDDLPF